MGRLYGSLFLHANMHYAEIPIDRLPDLAARSYAPALQTLLEHPGLKAALEFSGFTLEWLAENAPHVIEQVRTLVRRGDAELIGSTYANPILPLIPPADGSRQILRFLEIYERLFGDLKHRPRGFYTQEYAMDASVAELISSHGYEWAIVSSGQYKVSKKGLLNSALQRIPPQEEFDVAEPLCHPFRIQGARGSWLQALTWNMPGPNDLLFKWKDGRASRGEVEAYVKGLSERFCTERDGFILLAPADMEFVGDLPPQGSLAPHRLTVFGEAVALQLPSAFLTEHPATEEVYLKAGAGARFSDLQNWTVDPDNARLNALSDEARRQIEMARAMISLVEALGHPVADAAGALAKAEEYLLLADNSDGRGWKPIPERRLACYNAALNAQDQAAAALRLAVQAVRERR